MTSLRSVCAAAVLLAGLLQPVPAYAAAELASGDVDYQIWMAPRPGQAIVLVSVTVPPATKLPVRVHVPIPPGMEVEWAGEISGAGASNDIERPYTVGQGEGGTFAELELKTYRQGQIDTSGKAFDVRSSAVTVQFELAQTVLSGPSGFSVRIPRGTSDVGIDPLPVRGPEYNQLREALYTLPSRQLKPGEKTRVSVSYRVNREDGSAASTGRSRLLLLSVVIAVGLLVGGALVLALRAPRFARPAAGPRRRRRR